MPSAQAQTLAQGATPEPALPPAHFATVPQAVSSTDAAFHQAPDDARALHEDREARRAHRRKFWRKAWRHPGFVTGGVLVGLMLLVALVSLVWTPYPFDAIDMEAMLQPPSAAHWLGTDAYGHDIVSQLMLGARASILAGIIAVGIGVAGGVLLGLLAAARPGWVQESIMRLTDFLLAFPAILTAIMFTAVLGANLGNAILAVGIYNIPTFVRLTRATAASVWSREYVLAARAAGMNARQITLRHVLPNIMPVLLVQVTVRFAIAILAEAALSYLGFGVQPPQPSWGKMLADAQALMFEAPWLAIWPGLAIMLAVLGLNLLGDALGDLLDPRRRRRV